MRGFGTLILSKGRRAMRIRHRDGQMSTAMLVGLEPFWNVGPFRAGPFCCVRPGRLVTEVTDGEPRRVPLSQ